VIHTWRLNEMPPFLARELLRKAGALILPVGTLVFRGSHLPLGCDTLILERLADDLAVRTAVPHAPAIAFGVQPGRDAVTPGAAALRRKTLHRLLNELIAAWEENAGVRTVFVLTAHAAEAHLEALSTVHAVGSVRVLDIFSLDFGGLVERPDGPVHGGEVDTSLLLHLQPNLVIPPEAADRVGASAAKGERLYAFLLQHLSAWVRASQRETFSGGSA
jgi:creatinine amidohydrolase